jgi:hypothetical protein
VPTSDLFVLAVVVLCIVVVTLVAVQSHHDAKRKLKETSPSDREDQVSASPDGEGMRLPGSWS